MCGTNTGQYGRYNGFTEEGLDALFGFSSVTLPVWDSGGTMYWEFTGDNINFQFGDDLGRAPYPCERPRAASNQQLQRQQLFRRHRQRHRAGGRAELQPAAIRDNGGSTATTTRSPTPETSSTRFIRSTARPGSSTRPPALGRSNSRTWKVRERVTAATPPRRYVAAGAEQPFQVGTRRDIVGFNGKYIWNDWTITVAMSHEHKEGTVEETIDETWGGQAFTLPVDFDTDTTRLSADYTTAQVQAQFGYFFSHFTDNNRASLLPVPGVRDNSALRDVGLYSTPPSN